MRADRQEPTGTHHSQPRYTLVNGAGNKLSNLTVRSVSQLGQLAELFIGLGTANLGQNNIDDEAADLLATLPLLVKLNIGT